MTLGAERTAVENPFKTLLHNLVTGRIRVNQLGLVHG